MNSIDQLKLSIFELYPLAYKVHRKFSRKVIFFLKTIFYRQEISTIVQFFSTTIKLPIIQYNARIYGKIFDPYIFCCLKITKKMAYIMEHYKYLQATFSDQFISDIYLEKSTYVLLGKLQLDNSRILNIMLYKPSPGFMKEGELSLMLLDEATQISVFSSTFIFNTEDNKTRIIIGRIQGVPSRYEDGDVIIKELTKKMHGLRPSALLMFVFQCLSKGLKLDEIWAVTTDQHISRCSNLKRRHKFKMDYNQYWDEFGGVKINHHYYNLPTNYKPKEMTEVKSNKRSMYTRRFSMLNQLEETILNSLEELRFKNA